MGDYEIDAQRATKNRQFLCIFLHKEIINLWGFDRTKKLRSGCLIGKKFKQSLGLDSKLVKK